MQFVIRLICKLFLGFVIDLLGWCTLLVKCKNTLASAFRFRVDILKTELFENYGATIIL